MDVIDMDEKREEINLLDYITVLLKWKKLILGITLGSAIITLLISLNMPPIYRAETVILPPQQSGSSLTMALLSQMGSPEIAGAATAFGIKTPSDLYAEMLKSRTITDRVIDKFDLMKLYKVKYRQDARRKLLKETNVKVDRKSGLITISVEDKDPGRAAQMANAFVDELKNLTKGLAITEASQRRLFFEEQLKDVKIALERSEEELKGFGEKTGAIKVDEQAKAIIESIAQLRAQIAAKEVELKVMRTYSTPNNPDLQRAEEALRGLKIELAKLERKGGTNPDPLLPAGRLPEIGTDYMRRLRDLKFNETLYELLTKQYELAKLDEARDAVVIQVMDKAVPPEKKTKPKRRQMVMIATITGFFFSVFAAFFMEYKEKAYSDPNNKERIDRLRKYLRFRLR
jgi:uncharacterized protein involved in exopolysaccharide biosynthesis